MKKILLLISFTALIALSSCGGGGEGDGDDSSSSTSNSAFPSDVTSDMPY